MSAVISDCGSYRYLLERDLGGGQRCTFIMLNPSTADAETDDPTIRRCKGYARGWGYGRLAVVNLFAWRATDPKMLWDAADWGGMDIIGERNDAYTEEVCTGSALVVCAWGNGGNARGSERISSRGRRNSVVNRLRDLSVDLSVLRLSKTGEPCHPLYLPAHLEPQRWAA